MRSYQQRCSVAKALDLVGDRWTLLVVRELLPGPRRFKHLQDGLPGIGTAMLSARLKGLEEHGLVRRAQLPPPADTPVYELTEDGQAIEPVLLALGRFGYRYVVDAGPDHTWRPSWNPLFMRTWFKPEAAVGLRETYEFRIDDEVFHARVDDGTAAVVSGPAADPTVSLQTDSETYLAWAGGDLKATDAIAAGRMRIEGDRKALGRCGRVFPPPSAPAANR